MRLALENRFITCIKYNLFTTGLWVAGYNKYQIPQEKNIIKNNLNIHDKLLLLGTI